MTLPKPKKKQWLFLIGITLTVILGILYRIVFEEFNAFLSFSFLVFCPLVLGLISLIFTDQQKERSFLNLIFIPWTVLVFLFTLLLTGGLEDRLCVFILIAPFILLATLAAFIFRIIAISRKQKRKKIMALAVLPMLILFSEKHFFESESTHEVHSSVVIKASPETVWSQILEVSPISVEEYPTGLFQKMGLPRPITSEIDTLVIGGKRTGHFEGGLRFDETITEITENQSISFSIQVDKKSIRNQAFDQHVLNSDYFSFLNARYKISKLDKDRIVLTLTSSYKLIASFNWYGKLWGEILISDFQERLLLVIARRSENKFVIES